jgi:DNA-binding transcriptional regulator YdaS (Cro superfamily)
MSRFTTLTQKRGAVSQLARRLGITHSAILQWRGRVPLKRIAAVERITGIPRDVLRPDLRSLFKPGPVSRKLHRPS